MKNKRGVMENFMNKLLWFVVFILSLVGVYKIARYIIN